MLCYVIRLHNWPELSERDECVLRSLDAAVFTSAAPPVFILQLHSMHTHPTAADDESHPSFLILLPFSPLSNQRLLLHEICTGRNTQYDAGFTTIFSTIPSQQLRMLCCLLAFLSLVNTEGAPVLDGRLAFPCVICGSIGFVEVSEVVCLISDMTGDHGGECIIQKVT